MSNSTSFGQNIKNHNLFLKVHSTKIENEQKPLLQGRGIKKLTNTNEKFLIHHINHKTFLKIKE